MAVAALEDAPRAAASDADHASVDAAQTAAPGRQRRELGRDLHCHGAGWRSLLASPALRCTSTRGLCGDSRHMLVRKGQSDSGGGVAGHLGVEMWQLAPSASGMSGRGSFLARRFVGHEAAVSCLAVLDGTLFTGSRLPPPSRLLAASRLSPSLHPSIHPFLPPSLLPPSLPPSLALASCQACTPCQPPLTSRHCTWQAQKTRRFERGRSTLALACRYTRGT
jgi:hypothetical protein